MWTPHWPKHTVTPEVRVSTVWIVLQAGIHKWSTFCLLEPPLYPLVKHLYPPQMFKFSSKTSYLVVQLQSQPYSILWWLRETFPDHAEHYTLVKHGVHAYKSFWPRTKYISLTACHSEGLVFSWTYLHFCSFRHYSRTFIVACIAQLIIDFFEFCF